MSPSEFADLYVPARVRPFFFLSHPSSLSPKFSPPPSQLWSRHYDVGKDDFLFFIGWALIMVLLRAVIMSSLRWMALSWLQYKARRRRTRSEPSSSRSNELSSRNGHSSVNGHANGKSSSDGESNGLRKRNVSRDRNGKDSKPAGSTDAISRPAGRAQSASRQFEKTATRFSEQGFALVYYSVVWAFGLWVNMDMYPERMLDMPAYFESYPHRPIPGPLKFYYLIALTFYTTQVVILNLEAWRKDHWQMLGHHVVTVGLIAFSYTTNITHVGAIILVLLDWCDIFLPLAKMAKYLGIPLVPDITFVVFLISWLVTRQILFAKVILSIELHGIEKMDSRLDVSQGRVLSKFHLHVFFASLAVLYVLICVWFWMACKVAYKVVMGQPASDTRSDDDSEDEEDPSSSETSSIASGTATPKNLSH